MSITFPRVPVVEPGDKFKSSQLVALANGINARLVSGLCEPWRIVYYFYSALLQIRNPNGSLYPAKGEFLEFYQHVLPTDAQWPLTGPGDPEGANVASTMPSFVFGNDAADLYDESQRISDLPSGGVPLALEGSPYTEGTARYYWELAKLQRGGYDPKTGLINSPAFDAARSHFRIVQSGVSPHGKSWGGYAPTPESVSNCSDASPSFNYFFTPTETGVAAGKTLVSFTGSCITDLSGGPSEVAFVYRFPWAFVVVQNSGAITYLDRRYYIEGPYTSGARLRKQDGEFPGRVLNHFASQFRGTEEQRAQTLVKKVGFWTQEFFTSQYALAPAIGNQIEPDKIHVDYPIYESTGSTNITAGTVLANRATGATSHAIESGFVIYSVMVGAAKLAEPATVAMYSSGVEVGRVTLTPDANGDAADVLVLDQPSRDNISMKVVSGARLTSSSGGILCELAELLEYKPEHHDWCLVIRLSGARITPSNGTDGSGLDEESAKAIGDNYFRWGAIINSYNSVQLYESFSDINSNAVMESARLLSKRVRLLNRFQLRAYAVENGKSCLWFERFAYGYGLGGYQSGGEPPPSNEVPSGYISPDTVYKVAGVAGCEIDYNGTLYGTSGASFADTFTGGATTVYTVTVAGSKVFLSSGIVLPPQLTKPIGGDIFDDLGPALAAIPSGELVWGRTYKASGAGVGYEGAFYNSGETFTAQKGKLDYYGGGTVYESNGIISTAEPTGYSREWVMGLQLKGYNTKESSVWKPGAFSDYSALSERCQFYPDYNSVTLPPDLKWQFQYGEKLWLSPELPTSYRYATANGYATNEFATADFYKSCRLYEPCLNVEKTENVLGDGNTQLVKVTLSGRLHATATAIAAGDISSTYSSWVLADLDAETYRTDENGIRDFIASQNGHTPLWKTGDAAVSSVVTGYPDAPVATCYPSLFFVKLLEKPYEDANNTQDDSDSKLRSDYLSTAELYLRLMCEGCVDGKTTQEVGCATGTESVFDYTWANACFDANGLPWVPALASTITDRLTSDKVREDAPKGFGVVPLTIPAAEQFNWLARICNVLTRFRVMLPMKFETATVSTPGLAQREISAADIDGANVPGTLAAINYKGFAFGTPVDAPNGPQNPFAAATFCGSQVGANIINTAIPGTGNWYLTTERTDESWQFTFVDPDAQYACQPSWYDMLSTYGELLATTHDNESPLTFATVTDGTGSTCGAYGGEYFKSAFGPSAWKLSAGTVYTDGCKFFAASGTLHAEGPPPSGAFEAAQWAGTFCNEGSQRGLSFTPVLTDAIILRVPLA